MKTLKPASKNRMGAARSSAKASSPEVKAGVLKLTSILVPSDFSPESKKALTYAVAFARQFHAKLTLLHVIEPSGTPDFAKAFPLAMEDDQVMRECKRELEKVVQESEIEPELIEKILVRFGRAYNEITDAARSLKSDLIIISTHGYTGLKHALMGSTSERVVRHAKCPVLVVRPSEHEFLVSNSKSKNGGKL